MQRIEEVAHPASTHLVDVQMVGQVEFQPEPLIEATCTGSGSGEVQ